MHYALELLKNCHFSEDFSDATVEVDVIDNLPPDLAYTYTYGMTRLVLIPANTSFVIKIPFHGEYEDCLDTEWVDFDVNNDNYFFWDHCLTEILIRRKAKAYNVDKFFCPIRQVGMIDYTPIYIQEKIRILEDIHHWSEAPDPPEIQEICDIENAYNIKSIDPFWSRDVKNLYGLPTLEKLFTFINIFDLSGDLHRGNLGYRRGQPVILDYGGYNP